MVQSDTFYRAKTKITSFLKVNLNTISNCQIIQYLKVQLHSSLQLRKVAKNYSLVCCESSAFNDFSEDVFGTHEFDFHILDCGESRSSS